MFKINDKTGEMKITRGDDGAFGVTLEMDDAEHTPYTIASGDKLYFTVKTDTKTPKALIQKVNTGSVSFAISHSDTQNLKYGDYVYDIQLVTASENLTKTVVEPTPFIITEEVTW